MYGITGWITGQITRQIMDRRITEGMVEEDDKAVKLRLFFTKVKSLTRNRIMRSLYLMAI